jgi:Rrf2 family protein
MKISKKTQYGLRAMVCLAKKYKSKQICSTKIISQTEGIPFDFLEKIISLLEKADLVKGKKGIGGGYILAKNPQKITAKDIVEIFEKTNAVNCTLCGRSKKCLTKGVWGKIDEAFEKTLKSITLKNLIS